MSMRDNIAMSFSGRPRFAPHDWIRRVNSVLLSTSVGQLYLGDALHSPPTDCSTSGGMGSSLNASETLCPTPPQHELKYALKMRGVWPGTAWASTIPLVSSTAAALLRDSPS